MWTVEQRQAQDRAGLRYPSDLTDAEWALVEPFVPPARQTGRSAAHGRRPGGPERDLLRAGHRLPVARPAQGPATEEHGARLPYPLGLGRHAATPAPCPVRPGARECGSGSEPDRGDHRQPEREERGKGGARVDPSGYDAGKKVKGKKRHILVDTLGLLLSAATHPASVQDRDGAVPLLRAARRLFPFVEVIFADGAYRGETTADAVAGIGRWRLEVVRRGDSPGFVPLPKRWLVERTFAWLGRCRRLTKDFENLAVNALAFLCLGMIRLMLRRLARASDRS